MLKIGWPFRRERETEKLTLMETLTHGTSVFIRSKGSTYHLFPQGLVVGIFRTGPGRTVPIGKILDAREWDVVKMKDGYDHFWVISTLDGERVFDAKIIKWDTKPIRK